MLPLRPGRNSPQCLALSAAWLPSAPALPAADSFSACASTPLVTASASSAAMGERFDSSSAASSAALHSTSSTMPAQIPRSCQPWPTERQPVTMMLPRHRSADQQSPSLCPLRAMAGSLPQGG